MIPKSICTFSIKTDPSVILISIILRGLLLLASGFLGSCNRSGILSQASDPSPTSVSQNETSTRTKPTESNGESGSNGGMETSKSASNGKGELGVKPGSTAQLSLDSNRASRFYLYVPAKYKASQPIGVVLLFHGVEGTEDPSGYFRLIKEYANKDRFLIVAPTGDVTDGGSGAWCQPFVKEIMDLIRAQFNIDLNRQYIAAVSGGCLPGLLYGFSSLGKAPEFEYTNYCGQKTKAGYQAEFAAVGFESVAYSPHLSSDLKNMKSQNTAQLGFIPGVWADYGELSNDGEKAKDIADVGKNLGYVISLVMRVGEKHAPAPPYNYAQKMIDFFESHPKK